MSAAHAAESMRTPHQPYLELQPLDHARHCLTTAIVQHVHNEAAARVVQVQGRKAGGINHIHRLFRQHAEQQLFMTGVQDVKTGRISGQAGCHNRAVGQSVTCPGSWPAIVADDVDVDCWEAIMWHHVRQPPATQGMVSTGQHMQSGIAAAGCSRL